MRIFYITLVSTYIISLLGRLKNKNKIKKMSILSTILIITILTVVSGSRTAFVDTYAYINLYKLIGPEYVSNGAYEPGFILFLKMLKTISDNPQFMLFITALITNALIILTLRRYSKNNFHELIVYMYITSGIYISTMNGLRQYLAVAVLFASLPLIEKGKFKLYLLICLLSSTIHVSALIMIPVYFIARYKVWSKKIFILIGLTVVGIIFFEPIINYLFQLIGGKFEDYKDFNEGGANIIRILVYAVPVILSYVKKKDFINEDFNIDLFINMSLLAFIIMIFSRFNWIFARFAIYLELSNFILLPYMIKNLFNKKEQRVLYYFMMVFYFIFFWYEARVGGIEYIGLL